MTRRMLAYLLPALWRSVSGEVVKDEIVWAQQPAVTTSADRKYIFIDTEQIKANVVLTRGRDAYALEPHEIKLLFRWLKKHHGLDTGH